MERFFCPQHEQATRGDATNCRHWLVMELLLCVMCFTTREAFYVNHRADECIHEKEFIQSWNHYSSILVIIFKMLHLWFLNKCYICLWNVCETGVNTLHTYYTCVFRIKLVHFIKSIFIDFTISYYFFPVQCNKFRWKICL